MKVYISLSGFDTSQILALIVKYGIESNDKIILIRPKHETDDRGENTIQAVKDLSKQIDSNIKVEIHRVEHHDFEGMVMSLIDLIKNTPPDIITNISGGPREIFLAFTLACISQSDKIHKTTNYSDIDRVMKEITLPNIIHILDEKLKEILYDINENQQTTITEIASRLNLSESTVSRQVSKLFKRKALDIVQEGKIKKINVTLTGKVLLKN
ncbi:MAG: CRISPR-associated CARF protein Csa3 [ANME-2 cluster archaeon]|jgi:CRISPR-associated protein Csa3|nr:CRISPR-associated CARF protein Csa3 [ANME-2 cluster archaeon]